MSVKSTVSSIGSGLGLTGSATEKKAESKDVATETFPIPIRENFVAKIELPRNFKVSEAEKIGRVLLALAETDEASSHNPHPIPFNR